MTNYFFVFIAFITLAACQSSTKTSEKETPIGVEKIVFDEATRNSLVDFPTLAFPIAIDSDFFQDTSRQVALKTISIDLVKHLSNKLTNNEETQQQVHYLNDFYNIETAKIKNTYEDFVSKLDIGMTKDASCKAIGQAQFSDSTGIILWQLEYSSYEACPSFSGKHAFATYFENGKLIETMLIALDESGADAPYSYIAQKEIRIKKTGWLYASYFSQAKEEDEIEELTTDTKKWEITSTGFLER